MAYFGSHKNYMLSLHGIGYAPVAYNQHKYGSLYNFVSKDTQCYSSQKFKMLILILTLR